MDHEIQVKDARSCCALVHYVNEMTMHGIHTESYYKCRKTHFYVFDLNC